MRAFWCACATVLAMTAMLPAGQAETSELNLFLTGTAGPAAACDMPGSDGYTMSPEQPADGSVSLTPSSVGLACTTRLTWEADREGTWAGDARVSLRVTCSAPVVIGATPATSHVRFILSHNGFSQTTTLFGQEVCGPQFGDVTFASGLGGAGTQLAPGMPVTLDLTLWHSDSSDTGAIKAVIPATALTLEIDAPAAAVPDAADLVHVDLDAPAWNATFNGTDGTYLLNFTTTAGHGLLDTMVNGTGTVNATLTDGNGTQLFNGTLGTQTLELDATPGTWQLMLALDGFAGEVSFAFRDGVLMEAPAGPAFVANGTEDPLGAEAEPKEDAPVPMVGLAAVGLAAALRRRR